MAGRRTKYTPETVDKITQAIRLGATYQLACNYAGITYDTFNEWRKAKSEFSEAITQAEGDAAIKWLLLVNKGAQELPQWAAWMLERRYPQEYGKRTIEISGPNGGAIVIKGYANVTPDDWQAPAERADDSDV